MVRIISPVTMFRTFARMVRDVRPNSVARRPISIMSPCFAEARKLISEISFVTHRGLPSCRVA